MPKQLKALEELFGKAQGAATLDGGPVERVFDHSASAGRALDRGVFGARAITTARKFVHWPSLGHVIQRSIGPIPYWSLGYYLSSVAKRRGTGSEPDRVLALAPDDVELEDSSASLTPRARSVGT